MRSGIAVIVVGVLAAVASACGVTHSGSSSPVPIRIPVEKPPSPETWPPYPRFSPHSCWTRPSFTPGPVIRSAPSFAPERHARPTPPKEIVRRALARFGDRRFVRRIEIGRPPPPRRFPGFGKYRPPADALWAYNHAPAAGYLTDPHPTRKRIEELVFAKWEADILAGGLRDDFCAAGGRPLVGASFPVEARSGSTHSLRPPCSTRATIVGS